MRGSWRLTAVSLTLAFGVANAGPTLSAPTVLGHAVAQPDPYPQTVPVVARSPSGAFVMWTAASYAQSQCGNSCAPSAVCASCTCESTGEDCLEETCPK